MISSYEKFTFNLFACWILLWNFFDKKKFDYVIYLFIAELMILGFISLLLTFGQTFIVRICIPAKVANKMLPCSSRSASSSEQEHGRKLLSYERRYLAADATNTFQCKEVTRFPF